MTESTTSTGPLEGMQPASNPLVKPYKATLKMNDTEYVGEGETIREAIDAIKPEFFKSLSYLTIEHGHKKVELKFGVFNCKRLFTNEKVKEIKCEIFRRLLS